MNKVYFPNLNGIRFIAALLVIIHHSEQMKFFFKLDNYWNVPFVKDIGQLGVILFFVLSGFLITYLLLREKQETNTISVKYFYFRRILRIWPLYYLLVLLVFFVLPQISILMIPGFNVLNESFTPLFLLFVLFLPNIALIMYAPVPYISQAWSVGVEEQFYLIWPWIIKKSKYVFRVLVFIILFSLFANWALPFIGRKLPDNKAIGMIIHFWWHFNIDCMAIGGVAAWVLYKKTEWLLNILFNKYLQLIVYACTILALARGFYFPVFVKGFDINCEGYGVLFAFIILNLAGNPGSVINMENKVLSYLGKISYGLYMYHMIAIIISIKIIVPLFPGNNFMFYLSVIGMVIGMATLSFEFFEKRFIRMKNVYSKILSGDNAVSEINK